MGNISEAMVDVLVNNSNVTLDVDVDSMYIYHNLSPVVFFVERCGCIKENLDSNTTAEDTISFTEYLNLTVLHKPSPEATAQWAWVDISNEDYPIPF
jgi:hypothetical protein